MGAQVVGVGLWSAMIRFSGFAQKLEEKQHIRTRVRMVREVCVPWQSWNLLERRYTPGEQQFIGYLISDPSLLYLPVQ